MFLAVWVFFPKFLGKLRSGYIRIVWNDKSATCSCGSNCFYFVLWARLTGRSVQSYEKQSFLVFLAVWDLFPEILAKLKGKLC